MKELDDTQCLECLRLRGLLSDLVTAARGSEMTLAALTKSSTSQSLCDSATIKLARLRVALTPAEEACK